MHGRHDGLFHAMLLHGGDGFVRGAALAGHALAQHFGGVRRGLHQRRRPGKGLSGQRLALLGRQPQLHAAAHQRLDEIEHIGRPGAGNRHQAVDQGFLLQPHALAGRCQQRVDHGAVLGAGAGAGKQPGHALADQRRRVGHGAHQPLGTQPARQGRGRNAGGHTQVQGLSHMPGHRARGFLELLRLHGPDHHVGLGQAGVGCFQHLHAEFLLQARARLGEGLDHADAVRSHALAHQSAENGAGHVAASDEGNLQVFRNGAGSHGGSRERVGRRGLSVRVRTIAA